MKWQERTISTNAMNPALTVSSSKKQPKRKTKVAAVLSQSQCRELKARKTRNNVLLHLFLLESRYLIPRMTSNYR